MEPMSSPRKYPPEVRERAVRLVRDWRRDRNRVDGGIKEVAAKIGVHHESLRTWLRQADIDEGQRAGLSTDDKARISELERENKELRRANEILKSAAAFFARELDPRPTK
jgi:transposase